MKGHRQMHLPKYHKREKQRMPKIGDAWVIRISSTWSVGVEANSTESLHAGACPNPPHERLWFTWPGTRESTLNQNSVSCSRLMMRTSRSAPVPSALQADDPLPPCNRGCHPSAVIPQTNRDGGLQGPTLARNDALSGKFVHGEQADRHSSATVWLEVCMTVTACLLMGMIGTRLCLHREITHMPEKGACVGRCTASSGLPEPRPYPDLGLHNFEDAGCCGLVKPLRIPHLAGFCDDWREQVAQASALAGQAAALHSVAGLQFMTLPKELRLCT